MEYRSQYVPKLNCLQYPKTILENGLDQLNRPASPNTVIEETQATGESPAKKDWEVTKLKKRVDGTEEGIDRKGGFHNLCLP